MIINIILERKEMTKYRLSKLSGVPQTTVIDICNGKTKLYNCKSGILYKLSKTLNVTMELLLEERPDFEIYKSYICHKVKNLGDLDFIIQILEENEIRNLYNKYWYPECLYLLAMVDYLCRVNDIPLCENYNDLRNMRLKEILFPTGVHARCVVSDSELPKYESVNAAIPEFIRHNIVEAEVRNVC